MVPEVVEEVVRELDLDVVELLVNDVVGDDVLVVVNDEDKEVVLKQCIDHVNVGRVKLKKEHLLGE